MQEQPKKVGGLLFPPHAMNEKEALELFGEGNYDLIKTMLPGTNPRPRDKNFTYYHDEVYLQSPSYLVVKDIISGLATKLKLPSGNDSKSTLEYISDYFVEEQKRWVAKNSTFKTVTDQHFEPIYFIREHIQTKIIKLLGKSTNVPYRNLITGIVRYAVGMQIKDYTSE